MSGVFKNDILYKMSEGIFSDDNQDKLICDKCGFEIIINDNIIILHPEIQSGHIFH